MAAPRGYWLTAKGHCTSRQLVATRKGPAPMGILRTHNKPQLLRPHRQVFPTRLPGPSVVGPQACASCTYCRRTRMHGKATRPGKTIGFLSRENHYFPRPQSLSILPNSISSFTLRASLKAFGQSVSRAVLLKPPSVGLRFTNLGQRRCGAPEVECGERLRLGRLLSPSELRLRFRRWCAAVERPNQRAPGVNGDPALDQAPPGRRHVGERGGGE